jgi:hypothetical protein
MEKRLPAGQDAHAGQVARLPAAVEKSHFMPQPGATNFQMIIVIHNSLTLSKKEKAVKRKFSILLTAKYTTVQRQDAKAFIHDGPLVYSLLLLILVHRTRPSPFKKQLLVVVHR